MLATKTIHSTSAALVGARSELFLWLVPRGAVPSAFDFHCRCRFVVNTKYGGKTYGPCGNFDARRQNGAFSWVDRSF